MPDQPVGSAVMAPPAAIAWDYLAAHIHARHLDVLEEGLKERGKEGWELVFIHAPATNEYVCVFRRPLR